MQIKLFLFSGILARDRPVCAALVHMDVHKKVKYYTFHTRYTFSLFSTNTILSPVRFPSKGPIEYLF